MKKYSEVYPFKVEDEIKAGAEVYVLDKELGTTKLLNQMTYGKVMRALEDETGRYYFWKEEEVKVLQTTPGEDEA